MESRAEFLKSERSLDDFLAAFERGDWPKSAWNHAAHIAVSLCYLTAHGPAQALEQIRTGILHYNECSGTINSADSGYHETITRFWMAIVGAEVARMPKGLPRLERARRLVCEFGPRKNLYQQYYSFDVLRSSEARSQWIAPDLKPLP